MILPPKTELSDVELYKPQGWIPLSPYDTAKHKDTALMFGVLCFLILILAVMG